MIDADDVGNGFLFGGILVGIVFLAIYFFFSVPKIDECEKQGGLMVKTARGDAICVNKDAVLTAK